MARALRAWAIKGRKKLGPELAVRTSHSANKRYVLYFASSSVRFYTAASYSQKIHVKIEIDN